MMNWSWTLLMVRINLCCLLIFILSKEKKIEICLLFRASRKNFKPTTFPSTQIEKNTLWKNELLNMFFHWCSYKNSNFICANLMIYSWRFKKDVLILKVLLCFGFCAFVFEAVPHPSCYLTSIKYKTNRGPVLLIFLCNFCSFF